MKKSNIVIVLLVLAVIAGIAWASANKKVADASNLYVGITDATAEIINVSEIDLTIDKVEIHNAAEGWVTVSANEETYPLLALKASGATKLYAESDVPAGTYDRVRVTLQEAEVRTETEGAVEAVLPSKVVTLNTNLKVAEDTSSHLTLDFKADKSLHVTSSGKLVFAAVVEEKAESGVRVAVADDNTVSVSGGMVDSNTSVGVDLDGSTKANFELKTDNTFEVKSVAGEVVTFTLNGTDIISDGNAEENEETLDVKADGKIDVGASLEDDMYESQDEENQNGAGAGAGVNVNGGVKVNAY